MISFSDFNDETVHDVVLDGTPTYTVVDGGSKKGSRKLVSSDGYAFVVKRTLVSGVTEWRCSVRGKGAGCPAVIKQTGDAFVKGARGTQSHSKSRPSHFCSERERGIYSRKYTGLFRTVIFINFHLFAFNYRIK